MSKSPIGFSKRGAGKIQLVSLYELEKFLRLADKRIFAGLRDYMLFFLAPDCGLKPKEVLSLLPGGSNLNTRAVTIQKKSQTLDFSNLISELCGRQVDEKFF